MRFLFVFLIFSGLVFNNRICAQDELRWKETIEKLTAQEHEFREGAEIIILTGSSSAVMWKNIHEQFPNQNIINHGFGGSQMYELLFYVKDLILNYYPSKVFIYEGDNDIAAGKSNREIMKSARSITRIIRRTLPETEIYFISPKPSIARWNLKSQYVSLNKKLKQYSMRIKGVNYVDVWTPMLDENGEVIKDLFISDGLHMNGKGYEIWRNAVKPYMEE